jgi:hypothetical protein
VSTQAFLGGIPLFDPSSCFHGVGVRRQQEMSPTADGRLIMLSQPVVFWQTGHVSSFSVQRKNTSVPSVHFLAFADIFF